MNNRSTGIRPMVFWLTGALLLTAIAGIWIGLRTIGSATAELPEPPAPTQEAEAEQATPQGVADKWGIEVVGVHLTVRGTMLDLRYRVLDPAKAALLQRAADMAYLIEEATGTKLTLPAASRSGSTRRTSRDLSPGSTYSLTFPNPQKRFTNGAKFTLVMGQFRAEHLVVD